MDPETLPTLSGWGRLAAPGREVFSDDLERVTRGAVLCRGLGRSYGDSSLPPPSQPVAVNTTLADRILAFDPSTGLLRAEAGLSLFELNRLLLPRCYFTPVSPGTQFVTLGGMVASDVHGKNHHVDGTFGRYVTRLKLRVASDDVLWCSPDQHPDLFWATVGGMGLTGHILEVEVAMRRIPSPWIYQVTERCPDLDATLGCLRGAADSWPMTMAWMDCITRGRHMGRGIVYAGRWATAEEARARPLPPQPRRITFPFVLPGFTLNPLSMRIFNALVYRSHWRRRTEGIISPWPFWYPLDTFRKWNRAYGPRGFIQHQVVLPAEGGTELVRDVLGLITASGAKVFLCVVKDCGAEGQGMLSFPRPGMSLALDLPMRDDTQAMVDRINEAVLACGGRIYLTKDALTRPEHFRAMEPRLERFQAIRQRWDPAGRLRSAQSVRLLGDRP